MATNRDFTISQLDDRVRRYLGEDTSVTDLSETSVFHSSGTVIGFIDAANAYAWDIYSDADEGWNLTRTTVTISGGSGTLPSDVQYGKLRAVQTADGSDWRPIQRATLDDDGGGDEGYRILGEIIEIVPSSTDVTSVRLTYTPSAAKITSSLQTIVGGNGYEQVVVLQAAIDCRIREGLDYSDLERQRQRIEAQFRESVRRRDRGTPAHTRDRRGPVWSSWRRRP